MGATPRPPPLDLGIPGLPLPPHLADDGGGGDLAGGVLAGPPMGGPFSSSLPRSLSGAGGASFLGPASLPAGGPLYRSVSDGRAAAGLPRVGSHPTLQSYGSCLPRLGGGPLGGAAASPGAAARSPRAIGADTGAPGSGAGRWAGRAAASCLHWAVWWGRRHLSMKASARRR